MYKCIFFLKNVSTHLFLELEEVPAMELFLKEINGNKFYRKSLLLVLSLKYVCEGRPHIHLLHNRLGYFKIHLRKLSYKTRFHIMFIAK